MGYAFLADALLVLHGLFIAFVLLGGFTLLWRTAMAWLHLPAVAWGFWVEWSGSICPLTPLEQSLRRAAGQAGYEGGFIERYLTAAIYPESLTRDVQIVLAVVVLVVNLLVYGFVIARAARRRRIA